MPPNNVRPLGADAAPASRSVSMSPATAGIDDALDLAHFTDTMSRLAATVCIAASADESERHARTVTAVTSLSAQPPSLLISITKGSDLARLIARTSRFSLNLLAEDQQEIGDAFAGKLRLEDRFSVGHWTQWPSGQPRLEGAATAIECRVAGSVDMDTHCLFVGVLTGARTSEKKPLMWYRRGYHMLEG